MAVFRKLFQYFSLIVFVIHKSDVSAELAIPIYDCFEARKDQECPAKDTSIVATHELNQLDTKFYLFTKENPKYPEFLHDCNWGLPKNTYFNASSKTVVVIHGWIDSPCGTLWNRDMKDEILKRGSYNVIILDYSWGNRGDIMEVRKRVGPVADQTAIVLKNIMKQKNVRPRSFHLIGMSLGSHVAGFIGQRIENIGRITGVEPGLETYYNKPIDERLDASDALLVDVIHTGAAHCDELFGFGYPDPLGHADFYVNGGFHQPPALLAYDTVTSLLKFDLLMFLAILVPRMPDHLASREIYKASINPDGCLFIGVEGPDLTNAHNFDCKDNKCAVMGWDFPKYFKKDGRSHKYYVNTDNICPFCNTCDYKRFMNSVNCHESKSINCPSVPTCRPPREQPTDTPKILLSPFFLEWFRNFTGYKSRE